MEKNKVVISATYCPWYNLALEEYLLKNISRDEVVLYLWQNKKAVMIGRNQNPWQECRVKKLEATTGKLARRLSGGGAVYHDLGNLNFTFIMKEKLYNFNKQEKVILEAVRSMDISAKLNDRNDLIADGKKFSGNAFYHGRGFAYHHGTLLVNSNLDKLLKYLQVASEKIKAKGVESVRSQVINLKELNSELTIELMKKAVIKSFKKNYGTNLEKVVVTPQRMAELKELYEKYSAWKWRFGRTPEFEIGFNKSLAWGDLEVQLVIKKGHIKEVMINSDFLSKKLIEDITATLLGRPYKKVHFRQSLEELKTEKNNEIIVDMQKWFETLSI